ncbi:c-type cytochrome [Baekduia soli]|uniref:c-type cytochrome n=1 Tax=Baekduia soli TaxID=496014 RepID=UPI001652A47E|nr:cytochrome c [Baekduia soli]
MPRHRWAIGILAAAAAAVAACGCGATHGPATAARTIAPAGAGPVGGLTAGRRLYVAAGCGRCHALRDAGARGGSGPDFDTSERLDRAGILAGLVEGANGMPSYADRLPSARRELLADYLLAVAWRPHRRGR